MDALAISGEEGRSKAAISFGERQVRGDPEISEWGNPVSIIADYSRLNT